MTFVMSDEYSHSAATLPDTCSVATGVCDVRRKSDNDILCSLQRGDFECAKIAVLNLKDVGECGENGNIISKALVQAMYLLWIKTFKSKKRHNRDQELKALRLIVTELVEKHGAKPTQGPVTAFHYCMQLGDMEILKLFFRNGVHPCHLDSLGNTPLHLACSYACCPSMVQCVLDHGGKTCNIRNAAGLTPLMIAIDKFWGCAAHGREVWQDAFTTIELLMTVSGLDINMTDFSSRTPLFIQFERMHTILQDEVLDRVYRISEKMLNLGADVNVTSSSGEMAIHKIFQSAWLNGQYMLTFLKLLLDHPFTNVDAVFTKEGEIGTVLTQLFDIVLLTKENEQSANYLKLMNEIVCLGANVDALVDKKDDFEGGVFNICVSVRYSGLSHIVLQLMNNILKNYISPAVVQAVNYKHCNKTLMEHLYLFATVNAERGDSFESPLLLETVFRLLQCGTSKADIVKVLQLPCERMIPRYKFAKHLCLWYRAGVDMKECATEKLVCHFLKDSICNRKFKALDCFLREGFTNIVLHCAEIINGSFYFDCVPLDLITTYVNQFQSEPLSLQICCVSVLKDHLQPNAICGVNHLQIHGRSLPQYIKDIILNEKLAHDIDEQ